MVYVDNLFAASWRFGQVSWRFGQACHMTADTLDELHEMAWRIGLKRSWFQQHRRFPHYDLTASKRAEAVRVGAKAQFRPVKAV